MKNHFTLFVGCLITFFLVSCSSNTKLSAPYEGEWQYRVLVKHAKIMTPENFTPEGMQKNTKRTYKIGIHEAKAEDVYYTGYFKLDKTATKSFEFEGSHYPQKFSAPERFTPIHITRVEPKDKNITKLIWKISFLESNFVHAPVLWITDATYNKKTDKLHGVTIVFNCNDLNNCKEENIAIWDAKRIPSIKIFSEKNYSKFGIWSDLIQTFQIPTSSIEATLKSSANEDEKTSFLKPEHSKVSFKAVLPTFAAAGSDPLLNQLCDPNFCTYRAQMTAFAAKNPQDPVGECRNDIRERSQYCCSGGSDNGQCECISNNGSGAVTSLCCCLATSTCLTTTQTTNPTTGATTTTTQTQNYQLKGKNNIAVQSQVNPLFRQAHQAMSSALGAADDASGWADLASGGSFTFNVLFPDSNDLIPAMVPPCTVTNPLGLNGCN
jgi:hypothetical protein